MPSYAAIGHLVGNTAGDIAAPTSRGIGVANPCRVQPVHGGKVTRELLQAPGTGPRPPGS